MLIVREAGGQISGLWQFGEESLDVWVQSFASIVYRAATATSETLVMLDAVRAEWAHATMICAPSSAGRARLDHLIGPPVITATIAAARLRVTTRAARSALPGLPER